MRLRSLGFVCGLVLSQWLMGCSGGGSTPPATPITITTTTLTEGTTNTAYSATLAATGGSGTYTWSVASGSNLPAGLSLSSAGVISGTPTTAALASFTVNVADSETVPQTSSAPLKLAISGGTLTIVMPTTTTGQAGASYNVQFSATGGVPSYSWSLIENTSPPPGLTLSSIGTLSGTPTTAGNYSFQLQVTDANNISISQNVSVIIGAAGSSLPDGGYSFSFSGTGPSGAMAINGNFLLQSQKVGVWSL